MRRLRLRNTLSPGDILMLTAAVRDLHHCHPGEFETEVKTSALDLWKYNPYLTQFEENDANVTDLTCHYPMIHRSNRNAQHFLHGFMEFLNDELGTNIQPSVFGGDVHLSEEERVQPSPVAQRIGEGVPYWIIVSGGKYDFTIKWWEASRYQEVVDHYRDRILFVQVGSKHHYHPPLKGVLDLRGETPLRELIRLVYHSDGVLCPVTFLMHLAAAVPVPPGRFEKRPCVVIAGGREPPHWEAYPWHQFIHTVGALPCCQSNGCWRARTVPLGDGDSKDDPSHLCLDPREGLPHCMKMVTSDEVAKRIHLYYAGDVLSFLSSAQAEKVRPLLSQSIREKLTFELGLPAIK